METIKEKTKRREARTTVAGYIRCKLSRKGVWNIEVQKVMIAQVLGSPESCVLKVEVPTTLFIVRDIITVFITRDNKHTYHNLLKLGNIQTTNEILLMSDKRSGSHILSDQNHYRPCQQC